MNKPEAKKEQPKTKSFSSSEGKQFVKKSAKPEQKKESIKKPLLAVVLVRGLAKVKKPIKETLHMIKLYKKNSCTIMEQTDSNKGMLNKVKDYVAYGEIDNATLKLLAEKRKKDSLSSKSYKIFKLNPPRGGFERKGIKKAFSQGGALGYRGSKINQLLKKMV